MHYVAKVIRENYPETLNFVHELNYLKKAAGGKSINKLWNGMAKSVDKMRYVFISGRQALIIMFDL